MRRNAQVRAAPHWLNATDEDIDAMLVALEVLLPGKKMASPPTLAQEELFEATIAAAKRKGPAKASLNHFNSLRKWLQRVWVEMDGEHVHTTVENVSLSKAEIKRVVDFIDKDGDGVDLSELDRAFRLVHESNAQVTLSKGATAAIATLLSHMRTNDMDTNALFESLQVSVRGARSLDRARRKGGEGKVARLRYFFSHQPPPLFPGRQQQQQQQHQIDRADALHDRGGCACGAAHGSAFEGG